MADTIYDDREIIFTKGNASEFAYVIRSGGVEILENYPDRPFRLALLGEGDIFGEMGLIDERPRLLTARAVGETRVSRIARDAFVDMVVHQPNEAFRYLRMFFERLRAMNTRVSSGAEVEHETRSGEQQNISIVVTPASNATAGVVPAEGLAIERFPFRVGRSSTRHEDPLEINDLTLPDARPFNVSRNHFAVETTRDGAFIHDRGSYLGTIVNGKVIGGNHHGAWVELKQGKNLVIAGSDNSPFRFNIDVSVS